MIGVDAAFNTLAQFRSADGGILLVDKPLEWTSFDVIRTLRRLVQVRKMGHAGTLDPRATGLLILASQRRTKEIDSFQAQHKSYEGAFVLGGTTASYDAAMPVENERAIDGVTLASVADAALAFTGEIDQIPPMYSALKVDGRRLYDMARKGEEIARPPRRVTVQRFDITGGDLPVVTFRVDCSKGTYVRSLVHDLGQRLGCGAYLRDLRRTGIGDYRVDDAWSMDRIREEMEGAAGASARGLAGGADADR